MGDPAAVITWISPSGVFFAPSPGSSTTATFTRHGTAILIATVLDSDGFTTTVSQTVTVVQTPTASTVSLPTTLALGATLVLSGTVLDQFGMACPPRQRSPGRSRKA